MQRRNILCVQGVTDLKGRKGVCEGVRKRRHDFISIYWVRSTTFLKFLCKSAGKKINETDTTILREIPTHGISTDGVMGVVRYSDALVISTPPPGMTDVVVRRMSWGKRFVVEIPEPTQRLDYLSCSPLAAKLTLQVLLGSLVGISTRTIPTGRCVASQWMTWGSFKNYLNKNVKLV